MEINLGQLVRALSRTLDLVGVDEVQHGKRVAYMALTCAESMGLSQDEIALISRTGLLHDCGVSSTKVHRNLVNELEWNDSNKHCEIGASRMKQFCHFAPMADIILHHHTRWEELKKISIPEKTKIYANLIFLVDRVDALATIYPTPNRLARKDSICKKIYDLSGTFFQPELVDIFIDSSRAESFWINMEPAHLEDFMVKVKIDHDEINVNTDELMRIASLFAQIVDAKSTYTAEHSYGVASLSRFIAENCGLARDDCRKVEVAGLLHDLGKLQVSDEILEHEGPLNQEEISIMHHHSYVGYQILKNINGIENIALWTANHHEKLDGSGYPFRKTAKDLSLESRIIIVADIFQAFSQNRPYRTSQPLEVILEHLKKGAGQGKLDPELVKLVDYEKHSCYALATGSS